MVIRYSILSTRMKNYIGKGVCKMNLFCRKLIHREIRIEGLADYCEQGGSAMGIFGLNCLGLLVTDIRNQKYIYLFISSFKVSDPARSPRIRHQHHLSSPYFRNCRCRFCCLPSSQSDLSNNPNKCLVIVIF